MAIDSELLDGEDLDTSGSSIPYLATWGEGAEGEPIERYAALIDRLARRLEEVVRTSTRRGLKRRIDSLLRAALHPGRSSARVPKA